MFLFFAMNARSQNVHSLLCQKNDSHKIHSELLQYKYVQKSAGLITYTPIHKVKFTIKPAIMYKSQSNTLVEGDAFNDVEALTMEAFAAIKYDARAKIYINKKWRFLMRAQLLGSNKNIYSLGAFLKV